MVMIARNHHPWDIEFFLMVNRIISSLESRQPVFSSLKTRPVEIVAKAENELGGWGTIPFPGSASHAICCLCLCLSEIGILTL